jgi:uncharacterized protein (TIGR02147 family)
MVNFFRHMDFREILKDLVRERKKTEPSFNFAVLAKTLGVQRTYISKVMNAGASLSTDQLFLLTDLFSLSKDQHDYMVLLIEHEKTGLSRRKKILQQRIAAIQLEHRSPKNVMKAEFMESGEGGSIADYYLDPFVSIMHMYLMLPQFGGSPDNISRELGLTSRYSKKIISILERLGIVTPEKSGNSYRVVKDYLQLSPDSPLNSSYYALFRLASAQQLMKIARDQRCVYSMTFAADEETKGIIHEAFLRFLREIETPIRKAPAQGVYQINFDLFPWR